MMDQEITVVRFGSRIVGSVVTARGAWSGWLVSDGEFIMLHDSRDSRLQL
jgi:hypothetical protein